MRLSIIAACLAVLSVTIRAEAAAAEARTENQVVQMSQAEMAPLLLLEPVKQVFSTFGTATSLASPSKLIPNIPFVGTAVDALLAYLASTVAPDAGAKAFSASPVVRELARRSIADLLGSLLLSVLVVIEAVSAPFAAPVAPFVLAHSVMQTVALSTAAAVGLRRLKHIQSGEVVQRRVCTTVLDAWWAKREADVALEDAITGLLNDDEEAEVFDELRGKVDEMLAAAKASTAEATDMWDAWEKDSTAAFAADDKSILAVAYRFVERVSSFAKWWKARLSDKLTKATWMRIANSVGDAVADSKTRAHELAAPGGARDRTERAVDDTAAEVGIQTSLYDAAKVDLSRRVRDALDIVERAQRQDSDELFPGDHSDNAYIGPLCISSVEQSMTESATGHFGHTRVECGEAAFVVDKVRKATEGFQFFLAPVEGLVPAASPGAAPSAAASAPSPSDTLASRQASKLRERKIRSQLKCLLLQGDVGASLSNGDTMFKPVQFSPRPMSMTQRTSEGEALCRAYKEAYGLIGSGTQYTSASFFSFGLRRKILLLANIPETVDGTAASFRPHDEDTRVTSISLVVEYMDKSRACKHIEVLGRLSLPSTAPETADLSSLFQLLVEQIQHFVVDTTSLAATTSGTETSHVVEQQGKIPSDPSWGDIDGFFTFGPFTPSERLDPAYTAIEWSSEHSKRCWQDARNHAIEVSGISTGIERLTTHRGLGLCHESIGEDLTARFLRLKEIGSKARAVKLIIEKNMHAHDLAALEELDSLGVEGDPNQEGIEMTVFRRTPASGGRASAAGPGGLRANQ